MPAALLELGPRVRSGGRGSERDLKDFVASLVRYRDVIAFADHVGLFGADPVSNEASVILSLFVIRAIMAEQVTSGNIASQMEELLRHAG